MNRFAARLRPQDNISLAQFGGSYKTLLGWRSRGNGSIDVPFQPNDRSCNNTDFYGAIADALVELRRPMGRKGAVVLTDGVHNGIPVSKNPVGIYNRRVDADDDSGFQKVLRAVRGSDAVLYFVAVNTDLNPAGVGGGGRFDPEELYDMLQVRSRMEQLALVSGGRMTYPKEPADVVPLFEQIGRELGTSYGLGYEPPNPKKDGTYRKIEVRVSDKNLRVQQSRVGYEAR
jgi:VWFA-related protein